MDNFGSWLTSTISQPLPILADIHYAVDLPRGKNYFTLLVKKVIKAIKSLITFIVDVIKPLQVYTGNFSILSPPNIFNAWINPFIPLLLRFTNNSYRMLVT